MGCALGKSEEEEMSSMSEGIMIETSNVGMLKIANVGKSVGTPEYIGYTYRFGLEQRLMGNAVDWIEGIREASPHKKYSCRWDPAGLKSCSLELGWVLSGTSSDRRVVAYPDMDIFLLVYHALDRSALQFLEHCMVEMRGSATESKGEPWTVVVGVWDAFVPHGVYQAAYRAQAEQLAKEAEEFAKRIDACGIVQTNIRIDNAAESGVQAVEKLLVGLAHKKVKGLPRPGWGSPLCKKAADSSYSFSKLDCGFSPQAERIPSEIPTLKFIKHVDDENRFIGDSLPHWPRCEAA